MNFLHFLRVIDWTMQVDPFIHLINSLLYHNNSHKIWSILNNHYMERQRWFQFIIWSVEDYRNLFLLG